MVNNEEYTAPPFPPVGDKFYNSPAIQHHQQIILQQHQQMMQRQLFQQQQLQRQQLNQQHQHHLLHRKGKAKSSSSTMAEVEKSVDVDVPTMVAALSVPRSLIPASTLKVTNLDHFMESVTPFIKARFLPKVNARGLRTPGVDSHAFFYLADLWESVSEWSVYGREVPLLLNGRESTVQYFVPFVSGLQLYVDPSKTSTRIRKDDVVSNDNYLGDRCAKSTMDMNMKLLSGFSMGDKFAMGSASSKADLPLFQFFEHEQPHNRRPMADKISLLALKFPELSKFRSCDLLPTSWICVAWYPIYRIPVGSTLRYLDASFLTFHSLSTQPKSNFPPHEFHEANYGEAARLSLPVFALAAYKLRGSIISPSGPHECEQQDTLLQAADNWLNRLSVILPDYQFFRNHMSYK